VDGKAGRVPVTRIRVSRKLFSRYRSIQQAIHDAPDGAIIEIEPGVYHEELIIDRYVELIGMGAPGEVVITGKKYATVEMGTGYALVRNLTLKQRRRSSSPIVLVPRGSLIVEDCLIHGEDGPGVALFGNEAEPVFRRSSISGKGNVAVLCRSAGTILFEDCRLSVDSGIAAVLVAEGNPLFRRCVIIGNPGYGVFVEEQGNGRFEECDLYGFDHSPAVGISGGSPVFVQSRIHDGEASGVAIHRGKGLFENCVLFSLGKKEPAIRVTGPSQPRFTECVVKHCPGGAFLFEDDASGLVDRCDLYGFVGKPAVSVFSGAHPQFLRTRIHDGDREGVLVDDGGQGMLESCEVYGFNGNLVHVAGESRLDLLRAVLRNGGSHGLVFLRKAGGIVQETELSGFHGKAAVFVAQASDPLLVDCLIRDSSVALSLRENARGRYEGCRFEEIRQAVWDVKESQPTIVNPREIHPLDDSRKYEGQPPYLSLLDRIVGQEKVKRKLQDLLLYVEYLQERKSRGIPADEYFPLHAAFLGPPDTGKRVAAEVYHQALRELGVLPGGQVVPLKAVDALEREKLAEAAARATGGILFVEKLHEIMERMGDKGSFQDFMREMVHSLDRRTVLVVSGEKDPLWLWLQSGVIKHRFLFTEYAAEDLADLFESLADSEEYRLHPSVRPVLIREMGRLLHQRDSLTRAERVRRFWEKVKMNHARRCAAVPKSARTLELLVTLYPEDLREVEFTEVDPADPGWLDALRNHEA
jgi:hypothetical protein